jgi:hypothetical protein
VGEWKRTRLAMEARGLEPAHFAGALERYARAVDRTELIRAEWEREGRPLIALANTGAPFPHPLVTMLERASLAAMRLGAAVGADPASARKTGAVRAAGRPPGSAPIDGLARRPAIARPLSLVTRKGP